MDNTNHALIVDDEPDIRELLSITLERMDISCEAAADIAEAHRLLKEGEFGICLTDMRLPDGDGLDLVAHIQQQYPDLPVAVITAHGNMESAVQALKSGAFDFVTKPVDVNGLRALVSTAMKLSEAHAEGERAESERALIGESPAIAALREKIGKLARSQAPVYISGESGTGKELVARMIHEQGPRSAAPFVPVNCGAIPPDLMESEFFGHKKGSFTGAVADKPGLFEAAHGGTLFLDEVAELPLPMQVKLLRAIQEKSIRPVGAASESSVDCRILSATHKDLAKLVETGEFRQDLYYRINVIELAVPPLRDRTGDLPLLVAHLLASLQGGAPYRLSPAALEALECYPFPGNVRELENILERAVTLCEGSEIQVDDMHLPQVDAPPAAAAGPVEEGAQLQSYLDDVEKQRIAAALEKTRWNKTAAARELGITLRALRYRMEKLGLN
ncbi:MAG: sigma-54-dependent Fis family transcriptional regulator [Gammaproteobacteria bacterium]|nr:sigma-54-dependent Fis family transcriptional regulator [Gammaproteobacteria bacterium]